MSSKLEKYDASLFLGSGDSSTPLSPALFPGNGGSTAPFSPAFVPGKAVTLIALSFRRRLLWFVPELLSVEESRRNRWVRWSQFPACSVETIGGFVFAGDVFSVPVAVVTRVLERGGFQHVDGHASFVGRVFSRLKKKERKNCEKENSMGVRENLHTCKLATW
ncbi:hypothetical protein YC2023_085069 [Brassica napus]